MLGAIEAGGTKFVLALAAPDGAIRERARIPTRTPAETFAETAAFFRAAAQRHGAIGGFGVASFGPIDIDPRSPAYGTFTTTPKPGWSGARFHHALAAFGAPIALASDVDGAALGEALHGAGRGCRTLAYTTVGTGIGTGVVRDGRPLAGLSHYEAGHVRVPHDRARDPFAGVCPFHGDCLEGVASGLAIQRRWQSDLSALPEDHVAYRIIGGYLGQLASTIALVTSAERIVFSGGVLESGLLLPHIRDATRDALAGYLPPHERDGCVENSVCVSPLHGRSGLLGAMILARRAGQWYGADRAAQSL
jgi:fructokinase